MNKSIIIVGAGIAGLSAGCYAQMNGFKTTIFEMYDKPGGLCTSWKRKDYNFNGCIQHLIGFSPHSNYYKLWQELGVVMGREVMNPDEYLRIQGPEGKTLILYSSIDRLERHLKEFAPEDKYTITELASAVRKISNFNPPIDNFTKSSSKIERLIDYLRSLPPINPLSNYEHMSIDDFSKNFRNKFLRETFPLLFFELDNFPVLMLMKFLAQLNSRDCGSPIGGSLSFARDLEKRYIGLGGHINYNSVVKRILVENNKAKGIVLNNGEEYYSDIVISAADGYSTIFKFLYGNYTDDEIKSCYREIPVCSPCIYISLGISKDFSPEAHRVYYKLENKLIIGSKSYGWLRIHHYGYDSSLCPPGKSIINVMLLTEYEYWKRLSLNRNAYGEEKKRIADFVINEIEKRYPEINDRIEVVDVATPVTYERYTGVWQGSFMGWRPSTTVPHTPKRKTLPELDNFYMCGQWTEYTGGIATAAKSARDLLEIICSNEGKDFTTLL